MIPDILFELGNAVKLDGSDYVWTWNKKDDFVLATNETGKDLFIFKRPFDKIDLNKNRTPNSHIYKIFHGKKPTSGLTGIVKDKLKKFGTAISITYESDKYSRKLQTYLHTFDSAPLIYCDRWNLPSMIVLRSKKIRVTKRGILG